MLSSNVYDFKKLLYKIFLFSIFLFPLKFFELKIVFYLLYSIYLIRFGNFRTSIGILFLHIIIFTIIIFQFVHGFLNNNTGASSYFILYLISPLFYLFVFFNNSDSSSFSTFLSVLFKVIFFFTLIILYKILSVIFIFTFAPFDILSNFFVIKFNNIGLVEISSHLLVLVQFFFVFASINKLLKGGLLKTNFFYELSYFFSFVILLLSGKTGIYLSVFGFLLFFLVIKNLKILFYILIIVLFAFILFQDTFLLYFDFYQLYSESNSVNVRTDQFQSLTLGIKDNFILGSGIGGYTNDRNLIGWEQPWAYELQYFAHIYHFGIPFFILLLFSYVYIFLKGYLSCKFSQERIIINKSLLAAVFSILLINGINPIISKFDFIWIFFIPIWIYNSIKISKI